MGFFCCKGNELVVFVACEHTLIDVSRDRDFDF